MIDWRPIVFVLGVLLIVVAGIALIPAGYMLAAGVDGAGNLRAFLATSVAAFATGAPLAALNRKANFRLVPRQMYLLTVSTWVVVNLYCAVPFFLSDLHLSLVDSLFEAVSGTTTTGSTILTGLDAMPVGILIWRSIVQWLGGVGIIVMVVAILPHVRVGGMRLFRSEASDKSEKITSRSRKVARYIGTVYVVLSIACAIAYWLAGMDSFNAIMHAMTTVSTGGYSTSDLSMRQFASDSIIWTSSLFMFLSGLPIVLLAQLMRGNPYALLRDQQARGYVKFVAAFVAIISVWIAVVYEVPFLEACRLATFHTVSIITTTGYVSIDYSVWSGFASVAFFFFIFVGACAGSTAGGIKIFRFQIAALMLRNQIASMLHPHGVFPNDYNGRRISEDIVTSVIAFSFVFAGTVAGVAALLGLSGLDLLTSLSGAATAVANVGPGLGDIIGPSGTFQPLPDSAKWTLVVAMLVGRLEILTVFVIFTTGFWRD